MSGTTKKCSCRWWDGYMDCCRHPKTYERMKAEAKAMGLDHLFAEYICNCRKGCGYEKIDAKHPAWDDFEARQKLDGGAA